MLKTFALSGILLMLNWIQLSGQDSFTKSELSTIFRKALEIDVENIKLKRNAHADSIAIVDLKESLKASNKALEKQQEATRKAVEIGQTFHAEGVLKDQEVTQARREIRKQKVLKWVAIVTIPVVAVLTAKVADD